MKKLLLISLLSTIGLFAQFHIGDTLPQITLKDQFDKEFTVSNQDTMIIMAFEKDISVAISDYLKKQPSAFLETHHTKYISDISSMPSLITSMFAMPKMKKYPFSVMLINDDFGGQFDRQEGKITVYKLKKQKITDIQFIAPDTLPTLFEK